MTQPRMTLDEFIARLHCLRGPWWTRLHQLRSGPCCPITAVALCETDMWFHNANWPEAAKAIGLNTVEAGKIAAAADGHLGSLRQRLIEAVRG